MVNECSHYSEWKQQLFKKLYNSKLCVLMSYKERCFPYSHFRFPREHGLKPFIFLDHGCSHQLLSLIKAQIPMLVQIFLFFLGPLEAHNRGRRLD